MILFKYREPLTKSECRTNSMSLRDLKRAAARRDSQLMALVLNKGCNNAEVRFRPRLKARDIEYLVRGSLIKQETEAPLFALESTCPDLSGLCA